jgi:hypothetical protein
MYEGVWRSGNRLVMRTDAVLPDRCIKTNQAADGNRVQLRLRWHHPALYLVLLVNLIVYVIVATFVSKTAVVWMGLSETARRTQRRMRNLSLGLVLGGLALAVVTVFFELNPYLFFGGALSMFVAVPVYVWGGARLVVPALIDGEYVWLTGVHPDYLDLLPEWDSASGRPRFA